VLTRRQYGRAMDENEDVFFYEGPAVVGSTRFEEMSLEHIPSGDGDWAGTAVVSPEIAVWWEREWRGAPGEPRGTGVVELPDGRRGRAYVRLRRGRRWFCVEGDTRMEDEESWFLEIAGVAPAPGYVALGEYPNGNSR